MNWDMVGAVAELLGALGVILSLAYLAVQIRQNSRLLAQTNLIDRANAAVVSANHGAEFPLKIAESSELSRIWHRGLRDFESLEADERDRFTLVFSAQMIQIDVNHFLGTSGALDAEVFAIWDRVLELYFEHPHFLQLLESGSLARVSTESFMRHVEKRRAARRS